MQSIARSIKRSLLYLAILLLIGANSSLALAANLEGLCSSVFAAKQKFESNPDQLSPLTVIRQNLLRDYGSPEPVLDSLTMHAGELTVLGYLGGGSQGSVYRVRTNGQDYALKLFVSAFETSAIIQKYLGELNMAPKVVGILRKTDARSIHQLYGANDGLRNDRVYGGVIMDIAPSEFLKEAVFYPEKKIHLTPAQKQSARQQAQTYLKILEKLEIIPVDIDAVIDPETGKLWLADFGFFVLEQADERPVNKAFAVTMRAQAERRILTFINNGTSTFKARRNQIIESLSFWR